MVKNDFDERNAKSLKEFYNKKMDLLYKNKNLKNIMLNNKELFNFEHKGSNDKESFVKIMDLHIEEAELTVSLLVGLDINKKSSLLEIGGGMGLVYVYLKSLGYNISSIEPSQSGFDTYYRIAIEIIKTLNVDKSNWYNMSTSNCTDLKKEYDVIFSNNVLEHIDNLDEAFRNMKLLLKSEGIMVHNTINYVTPYEPHLRISLLPFFPRYTYLLKPSLKNNPIWNGINFVTSFYIARLCRKYSLTVQFERGILFKTFSRFENDEEFAKRQHYFLPIYNLLKITRIIKLLYYLPSKIVTPMRFIVRKKI